MLCLTGILVPVDEIHLGGPPRDGIPAIDAPRFVGAEDSDFLEPTDRVLGLERNGLTRAYPIAIMNWHETVNDRVGGDAVVVTYCPLCGTGVAFESHVGDRDLSFGVSGLLYNHPTQRQKKEEGAQEWRMGYTARIQWNHAEAVQYWRSGLDHKAGRVDER